MKIKPEMLAWVMCLWYVSACAALKSQPAQCPDTDIAKIEAAYIAEAVSTCHAEGAKSAAECKAFPAIRDKYAAKRAAYVECK